MSRRRLPATRAASTATWLSVRMLHPESNVSCRQTGLAS
jgi:hypothetical protein